MKAFVLERYGKKRALQSADMPAPTLRDDEVLVRVHASGVNLLDSKIRDGELELILPYRLPLVLGHDVAGVVLEAGARATQFTPGDEVYARLDNLRIGSFAEFVAVKETSLAPKPKNLSMEVVLNSQDGKMLEKSLRVLKPGGTLVSISGPPDPEFGQEIAAPGFVRLVMRLLSASVRRKARGRGIGYSFLFMKASGSQLRDITRLIEAGAIRPVIDKVFPFGSTNEAMAYVDTGRAKGKVVIRVT